MKIRRAELGDIPQLEEIFYFTRKKTFLSRHEGSFRIDDYQISTLEDEVWVAEINGTIAGFISIYLLDNFIHNLFIHPKFQGQGIGKQLLQIAERRLSHPITLKIAMDNLRACGFYEKHGYYQVSVHEDAEEPYLLYKKD